MAGDLAGKRALVTGASRGIGRAIAVGLAAQGAQVYCLSTKQGGCDQTAAACAEAGGGAVACVGDVSNQDSVSELAKRVLGEGQLDILVNNAGITRDGLFMRMSEADFDVVIGTNLKGCFLLCKAFARSMAKAGGARIVNIGSVVGVIGNAGQANYAASKAGLIGLSKSLAKEFGGRGMTVNVVAPGFIETDMTADLSERIKSETTDQIVLGRLGCPDDIAGVVAFLCSSAGAYITGQVLVVDGGLSL